MVTRELLAEANKGIPTVSIKGKEYIMVKDRIKRFREIMPDGSIMTDVLDMSDGTITIKATVTDPEGRILATGIAHEIEGSSNINRTSHVENCVPLGTQILTKDGWKYYYQVSKGDEVLSYNMETGLMEYTKVLKVNVYKKSPLVNMATSRFNVTCTSEHKWLARTQHKGLQKIKTKDLTNSWKIVQAVCQNVEASKLGKQLGWLMCDCEMNYTQDGLPSTGYISQSKHVKEVTDLFGKGTKVKKYCEEWLDNYEWVIPAEKVRDILGKFKIATYDDLMKAMLNAPIEDVKGCFEAMMLADGGDRGFASTYLPLVNAMQVMCARLGYATSFITARVMKKSTKPIYTLGIKKGDGAYFSEMKVSNIPLPADVWCPTTENGTWVMRQGTFVTLTSNCETSAIGRALGVMGIGIDDSLGSADEVANAIQNQQFATDREKQVFIKRCEHLGQDPQDILRKVGWQSGRMTTEQHGKALIVLKEIEEGANA